MGPGLWCPGRPERAVAANATVTAIVVAFGEPRDSSGFVGAT